MFLMHLLFFPLACTRTLALDGMCRTLCIFLSGIFLSGFNFRAGFTLRWESGQPRRIEALRGNFKKV